MMIMIGLTTLLILLSDFVKKKISGNVNILNLVIALLPIFIQSHFVSDNFKFILSGILLLNYTGSSSRTQSLLMLISLSLQKLGLSWNDSILLTFLSSFFDRFQDLKGVEKLLLILGSVAIYTDIDMLAVTFVYLNSLYSKNEKIELSILSSILIFSTFNFIEMSETVSYFHNYIYLFTLFFLTSRNNILVITISFFMISFAHLQFEHMISFSYTALAMCVVTKLIQYLFLNYGGRLAWLRFSINKEDVIFIICLLGLSYKWNISLVYLFTTIVVIIYTLDRWNHVDFKDVAVRKSTVFNLVLALLILQPWTRGFNFFGFQKILGDNLLSENIYLPLIILILIMGVTHFLYTKARMPELIKSIIFKLHLKSEYRLNFLVESLSNSFGGYKINKFKPEGKRNTSLYYVANGNMFKYLIVLSLFFILICTIKVVMEL